MECFEILVIFVDYKCMQLVFFFFVNTYQCKYYLSHELEIMVEKLSNLIKKTPKTKKKRMSFSLKATIRGGSRTSPRRRRQSLGGHLPHILVIFSEKPYEIKEILVPRGGAGRGRWVRPPKSATKFHSITSTQCNLADAETYQ